MEIRWIQGLRKPDRDFPTDWREVLFARLSFDFERLKGSPNTVASEKGLGLVPCVYYFIHRCEPDFSDSAMALSGSVPASALISPFDTGGLWHGHYPGCESMADNEKKELVETYSFAGEKYVHPFQTWGAENFDSLGDYAMGSAPRSGPYAERLKNDGWRDVKRIWTWEARVPISDPPNSIHPVRLFMHETKFREYLSWVLSSFLLDAKEKADHIDLVMRIYKDCGDRSAAEPMNDELTGVSSW